MLEVSTGCRLHFGLMELAASQPHRFAGLGLMVQAPRVGVRVGPRSALEASRSTNPEIDARVQAALEHAQQVLGQRLPNDWSVAAFEHPGLHSGLGLGTQLAAATAAATQLACVSSLPDEISHEPSAWRSLVTNARAAAVQPMDRLQKVIPSELALAEADQVVALARLSGRGKRSAVGLHGFLYGGLIQDLGQNITQPEQLTSGTSQSLGKRSFGTRSTAFPSMWPIVLILSTEGGDMCGAVEEHLIAQAGATPNRERTTMLELSDACMAAAASADFHRFVVSLESYMNLAATLFATVQAGRYRDARIAQRVALAQQAGLRGVGQSSWGPTVFCFADSDAVAHQAALKLQRELANESVEVVVTHAAHQGASWRQLTTGVQHAS